MDDGVINVDYAERAERAFARAGGSLVDILVRLSLCDEKALATIVAEVAQCELFSIDEMPEEAIRPNVLSIPFLRDSHVLPLRESEDVVVLAVANPCDDFTTQSLRLIFGKPIKYRVATASLIEDSILRLYSGALGQSVSEVMALATGDVTEGDLAKLKESASEAPIVRFVDRLVAKAVDVGASDIHIEPLERKLRVRMRIDGVLIADEPAPLTSAQAIVSRIKILARLDIAERRLPQDGSIKMNVRGRDIDFRVATTPVVHGEEVVVRILDQSAVKLNLADLGFSTHLLAKIASLLARPNGVLLVTGPTGSGKSTTLYAALSRLNREDRKIITVEDPVEYKIDGLNQIQVKPEIGLDFARSLRSILRHDPDIVMVGEIRDAETARIATQAALTGHLVLSTLHTNDAPSAITRLLDMGIEDYLVTSTVIGVVAQRLVRTLCSECKVSSEVPANLRLRATIPTSHVYTPKGCSACRGTGFHGRTVIAELMELTGALRNEVLRHSDAAHLRSVAIGEGMQTIFENGIEAMMAGVTSYDEILRVAHDVECMA